MSDHREFEASQPIGSARVLRVVFEDDGGMSADARERADEFVRDGYECVGTQVTPDGAVSVLTFIRRGAR